MKILLISVGGVVGLIILFVVWRLLATFQATRSRDSKLSEQIEPLIRKLQSGNTPEAAEIAGLAQRPETRRGLYEALKSLGREDLFPEQYRTIQAAAEADLVCWLLHPNELGAVPDALELMTIAKREYRNKYLEYYVFRYKMNDPHWAAKDGWMVGISGPYAKHTGLYSWAPGTFSTFDSYESKTPEEHVDWLHETMIKKGMYESQFADN
jgi:hypothetical protein